MTEKEIKELFNSPTLDIGWNIEQAYSKRKCHNCQGDILKNEYHLATYRQKPHQTYSQRSNVCMICAEPVIKKRMEDVTKVAEAIDEYLKLKPQIRNRMILNQMKEGTYKKED